MHEYISISGARHHNLKSISIDIPRHKLVVICGPSGSGKSTLAFDIIYAEGQRRYVESLSVYARQFLPQMDKPLVDKIQGLSPAISIEQHALSRNPRSTVGTVTEIYDFLRVFFARLGRSMCPGCSLEVSAQTSSQIIESIMDMEPGTRFMVLSPLAENKKGSHVDLLKKLRSQGFARVRINKEITPLEPLPELDKNRRYSMDLIVDRLVLKPEIRRRLADSVELALSYGKGTMLISVIPGDDILFSTEAVCQTCRQSMPRPSPQLFSFNSPQGACGSCSGIGSVDYFEADLIAPNRGLSINQGAVIPWKNPRVLERYRHDLNRLAEKYGFSLDTRLENYSPAALEALFAGDTELGFEGVLALMEQGYGFGHIWRDELSRFRQSRPCPACKGARLRPEALSVYVKELNIQQFTGMSIAAALDWLQNLKFEGLREKIAGPLVNELTHRLKFLVNVGLDYISLSRNMSTLSGGEAQRIRLAGQLGTGLVGVTYVLDEPSIGLHPRDNNRLINTLRQLQRRGNTVLVVEHDEAAIRSADHVVELGPGSGALGGEIVFQGQVRELLGCENSLTGKYLRREMTIARPAQRRRSAERILLQGVKTNNLKNIDLSLPLNCLVVVTGVSGSGKSSLVVDSLYKHLALARGQKVDSPGIISGIQGAELVEKIIAIDQSPIGRTPRSNPATYTKVFDEIRKIFSQTVESRKRGYKPGRFSFNVRGGRCESCRGDGQIQVEMHFLPDVYVTCEVCAGKRYNRETLDVLYRGLNISQVLDMSVRQARDFFSSYAVLERKLRILEEVGLDYLRLGQPATTLSGGEAQRIKISRELSKKSLPGTLYILDEPTTGLHTHEVGKLIQVLNSLVDRGASIVVIEHNLDVVACADYVLDLGPGGGENGGRIVARGTPEEIRNNPDSITGRYLDF